MRWRNVPLHAVTWILSVVVGAGVICSTARGSGETGWREKTLQHFTLDPNSGFLGADVSPDDRFLAIYAVNSRDRAERRKDENVYEIQIWDWREAKLVSRKILIRESPAKMLGILPHFVRYANTGAELIIYQEGHLLVLNSTTLETLRDVDMEVSRWPWVETHARRSGITSGNVADVEVDFSGRRAAVLISWGVHAGGELRAYDLESGKLLRRWEFPSGVKEGGDYDDGLAFYSHRPTAIAPDGKRIAISLGLPVPEEGPEEGNVPSDERNVLILDVDSGQTTAAINTGYLAGPIRFVPGDPLGLATASEQDPEKAHKKDSIKIWNANSGALLREINNAPTGIHYYLDVSEDGRVVMGFASNVKYDFSWLGAEYGGKILDVRIRLWDAKGGGVIATSPSLLPFSATGYGQRFRLSPSGNLVLMYTEIWIVNEKMTGRPARAKPEYQLHFFELR